MDPQKLADTLRSHARTIPRNRQFWDEMAKKICEGKIQGLVPKDLRAPVNPNKLVHLFHRHFGGELKPAMRTFYLQIIQDFLNEIQPPKSDPSSSE